MPEPGQLKPAVSVQGWRQFLTNRKDILDAYDSARDKARGREVQTFHGKVAEAKFRDWLGNFLPKRYGVTSGYVISVGMSSLDKRLHYDVIIYDVLNSPVLWVEDSPDQSKGGQSRAIPAEHVTGVLEVKAAFNPKNVKEAIEHLSTLKPLMQGLSSPDERYKVYLPSNFCCGLVFFELRADSEFSETALRTVTLGAELRQFFGGIILRGEGHDKPLTGRLMLTQGETPLKSDVGRSKASLLNPKQSPDSQSIQIGPDQHLGTMLMWSEVFFAQFAFDILTIMQGTYKTGFLSTFHGLGSEYKETVAKRMAQQDPKPDGR